MAVGPGCHQVLANNPNPLTLESSASGVMLDVSVSINLEVEMKTNRIHRSLSKLDHGIYLLGERVTTSSIIHYRPSIDCVAATYELGRNRTRDTMTVKSHITGKR
jgi:hypothetical protein